MVKCKTCGGIGLLMKAADVACLACSGSGQWCDANCVGCVGSGRESILTKVLCEVCGGAGFKPSADRLSAFNQIRL
jgi:DnaJ-class molecular chaperone